MEAKKKNENRIKIPAIIIVILLILGIWTSSIYNSLVQLDEKVNERYSYVQSAYQRRADLIPNLVEVTKEYAEFENNLFVDVSKARSGLLSAKTPQELTNADNMLTNTLKTLFAVSESYPELKANQQYLSLQDELAGTENRIKTERDLYNSAVKEYNIKIRSFPIVLIASTLGFEKKEMFQTKEGSEESVKVKF